MSSANNGPLSHADGAWLNRLPNRWDVVRLKFAVRVRSVKRNVVPKDRYIGLEHVESWTGRLQNSEDASANAEGLGVVFEAGDVLFGKLRPYLAKVFLADRPGIASTEFLALQGVRVEAGFLRYCFVSEPFIGAVVAATYGAKMPRANWEDIGNLPQVVPPRQEQRAIADFLDRETAKIDALIAAQERLISLLDEKRQATVTHAVTKGLDPDAPMKESGIEWIGDMPAKWRVSPVRRAAKRIQTGSTPPTGERSYYEDGEVAWYGPSSFGPTLALGAPPKEISRSALSDGVARLFAPQACLIVTIGATIGKVGQLNHAGSTNQQITAVEFDERVVKPRFASYALKCLEPLIRGIAPNTTLPILSQTVIGGLPIPVPPIIEQSQIAAYIDRRLAEIADLRNRSRKIIERLRERRTALITAAVTGQIDVSRPAITEAAE